MIDEAERDEREVHIKFYSYRCVKSPQVCQSYARSFHCSPRDINFRIRVIRLRPRTE